MRTGTAIPTTIDVAEARRAGRELTNLILSIGESTVPGLVLTQAKRELESLVQSATGENVVGPVRVQVPR